MTNDIKCDCENPANLVDIDPNAGPEPRVAETEICDEVSCETVHLLVRGDRVSFVSLEQARKVGEDARVVRDGIVSWKRPMPSDAKLPPDYVMVNDAAGRLLSKCDIYVVKWRNAGRRETSEIHRSDLSAARDYFGSGAQIRSGFIEVPRGPWRRVGRVRLIRYMRYGTDS